MIACPICNFSTNALVVKNDRFGGQYQYRRCGNCRFLFDQDLAEDRNALALKIKNVYGGDYFEKFDSGWKMRGDGFLVFLNRFLAFYQGLFFKKNISLLDYGAGNGYIASKVRSGVKVFYYDKYEKPSYSGNYDVLQEPKPADVIYAVELVEHLTDIGEWDFLMRLHPNFFIFTTCLSNNISDKDLASWIYLNPDAGHTALYSTKSLQLLAKKYGFVYIFFPNISCHIFWKNNLFSKFNFVSIEYFFYNLVRKLIRI